MVALGFTILFAVFVAISALFGLVRGLNKAVIRLITLALAVVLTFVIAGPITTHIAQTVMIDGMTVGELIMESLGSSDALYDIMEAVPLVREVILAAPAFVMAIVVFPVVFLLLKFVTWIVFVCVQKPLRKLIFKDSCNKEEAATAPTGVRVAKRFGGLGVGIVTGVVIFAMIMTPVLGVFSMLPSSDSMDNVLNIAVEQDILSAADADMIRQVYEVTDCTLVQLYGGVGISSAGKAYLNSVSKIEVDGKTIYLADELQSMFNMLQTVMDSKLMDLLAAADDEQALLELLSDKTFLDSLMNGVFQSKIVTNAIPELVATAVHGVANSMNVPANKQAVYHNMMEDVASAVRNSEVDFAGIHAYEQANGIASTFARSSVSGRSGVMTEEEYEAEVEKLLDLVDTISAVMNNAISGDNVAFTDSVAVQIVNEVKTQAAENGQETLDYFDASSVQSTISGIDSADIDAGEGDANSLLEQLQDQEKFETDVATVETIKEAIRESVKEAFADEEKAAETAGTLANVVSDLVSAVSDATDEDGNLDAGKLDFDKIASAVTTLQNSTLKDVGSSMLDMVAAGDLGGDSMISDVLGAVKEGYDNGEDIGGAIGTAGALINLGTAMGGEGEGNQEAMVNSLTSLINNLNDFTIGLLPSILSSDTIASMGVPAEYAQTTYGVIETLLKELMKLKGAEDYNNEVNSILSLYNLITTGVENFTEDDIAGLVNYAVESDAIFNTLVSISNSNPFGIEIEDAARADLAKAIEENFTQSGQTQRERDIYNAVAKLLGLDGEVNLG